MRGRSDGRDKRMWCEGRGGGLLKTGSRVTGPGGGEEQLLKKRWRRVAGRGRKGRGEGRCAKTMNRGRTNEMTRLKLV